MTSAKLLFFLNRYAFIVWYLNEILTDFVIGSDVSCSYSVSLHQAILKNPQRYAKT